MSEPVDSGRFLDFFTRKLVRAWIEREPRREIPWTPAASPAASTVALVSTAAVRLRDDRPFDRDGERRNPWWGDPSFRVVPRDTTERDVAVDHLHVDDAYAMRDLNVAMPLERLGELARQGFVGGSAPSHYSYMGYILEPGRLLEETVPAMLDRMRSEQVDAVLLVPF